MHDSKITGLLKNFDAKEFRLLYKYLKSPFFNYSVNMVALYEYLRKFYPEFDHPSLDRRKAYKKLFPGEPYDDKKMRNLLHEFQMHLESFIVQVHIREDAFIHKKLLVTALAKSGQYDFFEQKNRDLIGEVLERPYRDIRTYQDLQELEEQFYFHPATNKIKNGEKSLRAILTYLDASFIANKLRLANEVTVREKMVQQKVPVQMMDAVLAELEQEAYSNNVLFSFYRLLFQLNNSGEKQQFFELKQMLFQELDHLNFSDQQNFLIQLLNFAIRTGNKGDQSFLAESFELYWFGLENKLLFEKGMLTDSTFTNIVFGGCKIGAFDRVEYFIHNYAKYLEETVRNDAEKLALAYLSYNRKEYEAVDELIGQIQLRHVFYQIRAKGILIRALFELSREDSSFTELLQYRIDAFDKYLRRNQSINHLHKEQQQNFLKYLKKILQLENDVNNSKADWEKLKMDIAQSDTLINKNWLLEQLEGNMN